MVCVHVMLDRGRTKAALSAGCVVAVGVADDGLVSPQPMNNADSISMPQASTLMVTTDRNLSFSMRRMVTTEVLMSR